MVKFFLALALIWSSPVHAGGFSYSPNGGPVINPTSVSLDTHISYGQSWRSNSFDSFASPYSFNEKASISLYLPFRGASYSGAGAAPNSLGITLPSNPTGITNYVPGDVFALGRMAITTQQLLRITRDNANALPPILEICTAFPGSTWNSGVGGGLSPGSSINASISAQTLSVNSVASGSVNPGQNLVGAGVNPAMAVGPQISGPANGSGTYHTQVATTSLSTTFTATGGTGAVFTGSLNFGNLTVDSVISGTISLGQVITASNNTVISGTVLETFGSGVGGVGTYTISLAQTVASEPMAANGTSWANQNTIINSLNTAGIFPSVKYSKYQVSSIGYTQGASLDNTQAGKISDLTAMFAAYDALGLPSAGSPIKFYIGMPAANSDAIKFSDSYLGTVAFARTNAPGAGGTYSGRTYFTSPSYPWAFKGTDNIHTGDYGTARWGEVEGYVRWLVQDRNVAWTPLWRTLNAAPVLLGQSITLSYTQPTGPDFTTACLTFQSSALDGIQVWPNMGFNVYRSASPLTITPSIISCTIVKLVVTQPLNSGDSLEVSYAYRGPGGPNPGPYTGVGGNLAMIGPASVLFPGNTINAWAPDSVETVIVP